MGWLAGRAYGCVPYSVVSLAVEMRVSHLYPLAVVLLFGAGLRTIRESVGAGN